MSASDWMKMRTNLWDDPRVGAIADEAGTGEAAVVGALYWLWATADEHSEDGLLAGMTLRQVDRKTGVPGFASALVRVGWLTETAEGVQIVRFDEHNGKSAKRRASESVRKMSARDADKARTDDGHHAHLEVEVEREEKQSPSLRSGEARKRATPDKSIASIKGVAVPSRPDDAEPQAWRDWLGLRKAKSAPVTETVVEQARREAAKAGLSLTRFLEIWCARGSQGLQADWLKPNERAGPNGHDPPKSKTRNAAETLLRGVTDGPMAEQRTAPGAGSAALPAPGFIPAR